MGPRSSTFWCQRNLLQGERPRPRLTAKWTPPKFAVVIPRNANRLLCIERGGPYQRMRVTVTLIAIFPPSPLIRFDRRGQQSMPPSSSWPYRSSPISTVHVRHSFSPLFSISLSVRIIAVGSPPPPTEIEPLRFDVHPPSHNCT